MDSFLDIYEMSLSKSGEELCGDQVKTLRSPDKTIIVLSDGLGSGVKASILSSLTTSIIASMVRSDVPLKDVIHTVIGTLPVCKVRKVAYATFTILEFTQRTGHFRVVNFDNPRSLFFRHGRLCELEIQKETILDREVAISQGSLERGDFLAAFSDGVLYAGLGALMDFGWGRENIARYIEGVFLREARSAKSIVRAVIDETRSLYRGQIGDDATFVGVYARQRNPLIVLTGPPLDAEADTRFVEKLLSFPGRKVVCGGTTSNIVAEYLGVMVETNTASMRPDVPPVGEIPGVDLVTEGIFTIAKCLDLLRASDGDASLLPDDPNGAVLLARELLQADSVEFVAGQSINEWYQNPLLPRSVSIRKQLVEELASLLLSYNKEVHVEFW